jgi:hypothetical protein
MTPEAGYRLALVMIPLSTAAGIIAAIGGVCTCGGGGHGPSMSARHPSVSAPGTIRTCDLPLRRRTLYPLSYGRSDPAGFQAA